MAIVNFLFAATTLASPLLVIKALPDPGLWFSDNLYSILSILITSTFLVVTGIGFLRMSYWMGYVSGNVFAGGAILHILIYTSASDKGTSLSFAGMIYPIILLVLLNGRFRKDFPSS